MTLVSLFLSNRADHGKAQGGQQLTVTINLTDQLRANLASIPSKSPNPTDSSLDPKAQQEALTTLQSFSEARAFRLPGDAPAWLRIAVKELGQTRAQGDQSNPRILEYLRATNLPEDMTSTDKTPWSAAFISWAFQRAGINAPKSAAFAAFDTWGHKIDEPSLGSLVLIRYPPNGRHGGFLLMDLGETVLIVAGNTQNAVRVQAVAKTYIVEYRFPPQTSNRAMQPTAGRRTSSFYFMTTRPLQATLALASGG